MVARLTWDYIIIRDWDYLRLRLEIEIETWDLIVARSTWDLRNWSLYRAFVWMCEFLKRHQNRLVGISWAYSRKSTMARERRPRDARRGGRSIPKNKDSTMMHNLANVCNQTQHIWINNYVLTLLARPPARPPARLGCVGFPAARRHRRAATRWIECKYIKLVAWNQFDIYYVNLDCCKIR